MGQYLYISRVDVFNVEDRDAQRVRGRDGKREKE